MAQWLHKQTNKQRIIWGYKTFLDVMFLNVRKIIYIDADQVVNAVLRLWDMRSPRMLSRQGRAAIHPWLALRRVTERPSARPALPHSAPVVDSKFRRRAYGDQYRIFYDSLSRPNSPQTPRNYAARGAQMPTPDATRGSLSPCPHHCLRHLRPNSDPDALYHHLTHTVTILAPTHDSRRCRRVAVVPSLILPQILSRCLSSAPEWHGARHGAAMPQACRQADILQPLTKGKAQQARVIGGAGRARRHRRHPDR